MHALRWSQVFIRLEGDRVRLSFDGAHLREIRDLIAIADDEHGKRRVVAVGGAPVFHTPLDATTGVWTRFESPALAPARFQPDLAVAYLHHVFAMIPGWRLVKPDISIEIPGYEAIPDLDRLHFEDGVKVAGRKTLVNGRPARSRPRSRPERITSFVIDTSAVYLFGVLVRYLWGLIAP